MKTLHPFSFKYAAVCIILMQIFSAVLFSQTCSYTWTPQTSGTTSLLSSVKAVNELVCWIAGSNVTVRRTTDGGSTWLNGNPNPGIITGNITNIDALDADNAWITTTQSTMTYIFKTTNGGSSWSQVFSQTGGYLFGIHMTSATNGFAFGDPIASVWRILVTTNAGTSWTHLQTSPAGPPPAQGFRNSFQVSLPYIWFSSYPAQIIRSTNGGINWTLHNVPGSGMSTILSIHFNSPSLGFASSINMVKSNDAGSTYLQHPVIGVGNINGIEGSDNNIWYIRGENIYSSTNSGEDWLLEHTASVTQLAIDFPDNPSGCLTGWTVGHAGTVTKMAGIPLGINNSNGEIPEAYSLHQNYPNPFNPNTQILFDIKNSGQVKLAVSDVLGREVFVLVNETLNAGKYSVNFNASELTSGIYIYTLSANDYTESKKMVLIK